MKKLSVSMSRTEGVIGIIYIIFQLLVLPILVMLADAVFSLNLNEVELNFVCFAINFIAVTVIFRRFLFASFPAFRQDIPQTLANCTVAFLLYMGGNMVVSILITTLDPTFSNANDNNIGGMMEQSRVLMTLAAVVLAPVVEEILYRGVLFGLIYKKFPVAAYILSAAIFASLHVVGYIGMYSPLRLVLCFVQYIPASVVLAWLYVRSDTIFAPILLHITINLLGTMVIG